MFRFTIRNLLCLTLAIALSLAVICAFPISSAAKQAQAREWVAQQGGHVTFSHNYDPKTKTYDHSAQLSVPPWLVAWFGVDMFDTVDGVILDNQPLDNLRLIVGFENLRTLGIFIEISADLDFTPLTELDSLEELDLQYTGIGGEQLRELRELLPKVRITIRDYGPRAAAD
jgi:hypothetical protein